jgi:transposase
MNADYNAAVNILQRGRGLLSRLGGFLTYPNFIFEKQPSMIVDRNKMIMMEHVPSAMLEPHSL